MSLLLRLTKCGNPVLLLTLTGCTVYISVSVVEFRTEELMKKAVEKVNKHNLNGRPLKVKEVGYSKNDQNNKRQQRDQNIRGGFFLSHIFMLFVRTPMV